LVASDVGLKYKFAADALRVGSEFEELNV